MIGMTESRPKQLLKDGRGYYLASPIRTEFDSLYGLRAATVELDELLQSLPDQIHSSAQRVFLEEAITCVRSQANRAAIVMAWNLTFDHICHVILSQHVASFNTSIPRRYPKRLGMQIKCREDFDDLKESEILSIAKTAKIIKSNTYRVLSEKLVRRNMAAHPSTVIFTQLTAEEYVTDIVMNGLLIVK